jgi:NAD-dependent DNA ligase
MKEPKQNGRGKDASSLKQDWVATFRRQGIHFLETLSEKECLAKVEECDVAFHTKGQSLLSDTEYDVLREFIVAKYTTGAFKVGAPVQRNKAQLPYEMASMDKIKPDTAALPLWRNKFVGPYVLSAKLDGVSGLYVNEGLAAAALPPRLYTRGDGLTGQDISHLIPAFRLPQQFDQPVAVRGELIMTKHIFQHKYKTKFANIRNMVAGIVNRPSFDERARDMQFVAYEVIRPAQLKPSEQLALLKRLGFIVVPYQLERSLTNDALSQLLSQWRHSLDYEIDGIIVGDDKAYPRRSGNPEHAFAFKMVISDQVVETKVLDVIWTPTKDGYLKPRIRLEPVQVGGVKIEFASGFNGAFIEKHKIGVGAVVQIVRSGDVIPHVNAVIVPALKPKMPDINYVWSDTHVDLVLENPAANEAVLKKAITGFFKGIGTDGLSQGNVSRLIGAGFDSISKILKMTQQDFLTVDGFKDKMAAKLYANIKASVAKASLIDLMSASNLFGRGLGSRKLEPILAAHPDILTAKISLAQKVELALQVKGMAEKSALAFVHGIPPFVALLNDAGLSGKLV